MSTSTVMPSCGSQKKLLSMQRRRQTSSSMQNLQIRRWYASTIQCFLVFLILSIIILFKHAPKYSLGTLVTPWRLCIQDNWLIWKGHLRTMLTYHSTTIRFISASMPLYLCQMPIGIETHHFQSFPVVHGPNPGHNPLSDLYVVLELWNLF